MIVRIVCDHGNVDRYEPTTHVSAEPRTSPLPVLGWSRGPQEFRLG
jgi:hypothetical protein